MQEMAGMVPGRLFYHYWSLKINTDGELNVNRLGIPDNHHLSFVESCTSDFGE